MSEYSFGSIVSADEKMLTAGAFLWIWYADKIPPHLGISVNGSYFSLKYNGKDLGIEVQKPFNLILKRNIPTLLVRLDYKLDKTNTFKIFDSFKNASSSGFTCLDPIQKSLSKYNFKTVFELIDELKMERKILSVSGVNLPGNFSGIPLYGVKEIRSRLIKLENASIGKNISSLG